MTKHALRAGFVTRVAVGVATACVLLTAACVPGTEKTPKEGQAMPKSIVEPYLKIQTALAKDSIEGVKMHAGEIATASSSLGAPAMKIDTSALQLASAVEIDDAREKFGTLSEAIITYMDGLKLTPPDGVQVAMCPMKQKPWLQEGEDIMNPYFGSSMLTCGDFR